MTEASFATSIAGGGNSEFEMAFDELAAIVTQGGGRSQVTITQRIELEDRAKEPIEVRNFIKAAELVYTADTNARSAKLLTDADTLSDDDDDSKKGTVAVQRNRLYDCDADCTHDASGMCMVACKKWKLAWAPILKLLGDACDDHAAAFDSLPASTTTISSLTSIQARFAALDKEAAQMLKPNALNRDAFVNRACDEICQKLGREFHQVRATIRGQMCCVDKVSCEVSKLCRRVLDAFAGSKTMWLTESPAELGRHLSRCDPAAMAEHVKTLDNTGAQLAVFEKTVFQLADGCAKITERMREQLRALRNARPASKTKKQALSAQWTRKRTPNAQIGEDSYLDRIYGDANGTEDEFVGALRAFLDAEPNCGRIVYDGIVFFRDCYRHLERCMEQHLKRTEQMQIAFHSLGDALVQQRFIVHLGAMLLRIMAKMPLRTEPDTGKTETPMEMFNFLFGPTFRSTMPDADYYPIQLELASKGSKLPNTLRTYLYKVYTTRHMNAIQKAGCALFTSELNCLADVVVQCATPGFDVSDVVIESQNRDRARTSIAEMSRLCLEVLKYIDTKHACTTAHCSCCTASKQSSRSSTGSSLVPQGRFKK